MRRRCKKPPAFRPPELTIAQILAWADEHHARTGRWPKLTSGPIPGTYENWRAVDGALKQGNRGLPKGGTLARLLAQHRGVRNLADLPPLGVKRVLAWADAHYRRTGRWPTRLSGPVAESPGETWCAINKALNNKSRGFRSRSTLAELLARCRQHRHKGELAPLTERQILIWAEAHHALFGVYPTTKTGPVGNTGETWRGIDKALRQGGRSLPGNDSLFHLLKRHGKFSGQRTPYRRPGNRLQDC